MTRLPALLSDDDRILAARALGEKVERAMVRRHGEYPPSGPRWYHEPGFGGQITSECPDCAPAQDL